MQEMFRAIIDERFTTVKFEFNQNKTKLNSAVKVCNNHYYDINIIEQTCNCDEFVNNCSKYEKNDIRRLCNHLSRIIIDRELIKKSKDAIDNYILENLKYETIGIYKEKIDDDHKFAIIIYNWSKDIYVVTPKKNKDGYITVLWRKSNEEWTPNCGSKVINEKIKIKIEEIFNI